MPFRDEEIGDAVGVTAGPAQPGNLPDIDNFGRGSGEQEGLAQRSAAIIEQRRSRFIDDWAVLATQPGRVMDA